MGYETANTDRMIEQIKAELETGRTLADIAADLGLDYDADEDVAVLPGWVADDGNASVEYPYAATGLEAAREYVDDGSWGDNDITTWVRVYVWRPGVDSEGNEVRVQEDTHKIAIEPDAPECVERDHEWTSPIEQVGGCESNPGVFASGGGVIIREVCAHCGCLREKDTWAQDHDDAEQGLESVRYETGYADTDNLEEIRADYDV